jgi:type I restriction enzyme, S subunit
MNTTRPLSEITTSIRYGYTASATATGSHRFIRITDITDTGTLKLDGVKYVSPDTMNVEKFSVQKGDILIARSGSVGRPLLVREPMQAIFASYLIRFRLNLAITDSEYVFYFALSPQYKDYIKLHGRGAAIKNINAKQLGALPIPFPELSEQRRIVTRIKTVLEKVEEIEQLQLESRAEHGFLLESLAEAAIADATGKHVVLKDVCKITSLLIDPKEEQYQKLYHVGGANIESKTGKLIKLITVSEEKLKSSKFVFDESMVLYNKIRPYLIKVARPDFNGLCSADMYPLIPNPEKMTRDFLFYVLMSRRFTHYAIEGSNRAGMPKVNRKHLFAYKFILPTIDEQIQITSKLDLAYSAIEEMREYMKKTSADISTLRESILRKAFAGEL